MSRTKGKTEMRDAVRVTRIQVKEVDGNWADTVTRWFETMKMVRRAANLFYETWLVWHIQNQSREKIEAWLNARKEDKSAAGKCPVDCVNGELSKVIYEKLISQFPHVHNRVLGLLQNRLTSDIKTKVAANGSLPGWTATLLHNQGMPSLTKREYPIPFDVRCGKLVRKSSTERLIELSTWRIPRDGKAATSITDSIVLETAGRKCQRVAKEFDNIISGLWQYKGSSLIYDDKKRKWSVLISYQCPSRAVDLDKSRVAYLVPGRRCPFYVWSKGLRDVWLQGNGRHITEARERAWKLRAEKNSSAKHMLNRKGHGRKSANKWRAMSSKSWRNFVSNVNHAVSKKAVDWCVANNIGTLVYIQPSGAFAESRYVSGSYKNSTWEFHHLKTKLAYKCQDRGVEFKTHERGDTPKTVRPRKTADELRKLIERIAQHREKAVPVKKPRVQNKAKTLVKQR